MILICKQCTVSCNLTSTTSPTHSSIATPSDNFICMVHNHYYQHCLQNPVLLCLNNIVYVERERIVQWTESPKWSCWCIWHYVLISWHTVVLSIMLLSVGTLLCWALCSYQLAHCCVEHYALISWHTVVLSIMHTTINRGLQTRNELFPGITKCIAKS